MESRNIFSQEKLNQLDDFLNQTRNILITAHRGPDGDAIGSALALFHSFQLEDHNCTVILPDAYPEFYQWMPGQEEVLFFDKQPEDAIQKTNEADLIFCLDFNSINRLGDYASFVEKSTAKKVMIDHHQQPQDFVDLMFSDPKCCSTAQLVFEMIEARGNLGQINADIASCLYAGIMTDTGGFRFPSTEPRTHQIAAELIKAGANHSAIYDKIYDTNSIDRLKLTGYALSEKTEVVANGKAAIIALSHQEMMRFNYQKGDTEGLVNYGLSIKGVKAAVLITETPEIVKMSFRSKGSIPINVLAREHFEGGGHINAAGGRSFEKLENVVVQVKEILPKFLNENDSIFC